jgi:c-di-GMP-binding flagellar brake protein YcgR
MRVRILIPIDDSDGVAARVVEVKDDRVLLRVSRGTDSQGRALVSGGRVQLLLGGRDAAHLFDATVLSRPEDGFIAILLRGHPLRLQRRDYFRLAVRLPIAVCLPIPVHQDREDAIGESGTGDRESDKDDEDDEPMLSGSMPGSAGGSAQETEIAEAVSVMEPSPMAPEIRIFRLADLSGGGCLCLDPEDLLRPGSVYGASLDLHDDEPALHVSVEVVRRGISLGYPSAGLRFVTLAGKHRERIMRTLFREHHRRVATGRI